MRFRAILPHLFLSFEEVLPHTIAGSAEMYTRHSFTAATPLTTFDTASKIDPCFSKGPRLSICSHGA